MNKSNIAFWRAKVRKLPRNLSFAEASKILRINYHTARARLMKLGYKFRDARGEHMTARKRFHMEQFDFSRPDAVLAREHGCCREYVRLFRRQARKPKVDFGEWVRAQRGKSR